MRAQATEDHVREAIRLFKHSTMDAVKSGAPFDHESVFVPAKRMWRSCIPGPIDAVGLETGLSRSVPNPVQAERNSRGTLTECGEQASHAPEEGTPSPFIS